MTRALILGRFQPPHLGHLSVIQAASKAYDEVLVLVGSAQASHTLQNPFTGGERVEMLQAATQEANMPNVRVYPIVDLNRHAQWVAYVESLVPMFDAVITNNPLTRVLFEEAGYRVEEGKLLRRKELSGTRIRGLIAKGQSVEAMVPPAVSRYLANASVADRLRNLEGHDHAP